MFQHIVYQLPPEPALAGQLVSAAPPAGRGVHPESACFRRRGGRGGRWGHGAAGTVWLHSTCICKHTTLRKGQSDQRESSCKHPHVNSVHCTRMRSSGSPQCCSWLVFWLSFWDSFPFCLTKRLRDRPGRYGTLL